MPFIRITPTAGFLLVLSAAPVAAQQKAALSTPDASFEEPFTQVMSVRELASGKVLVADPRDKIVQLIDFAAASAVKIGREGSGPGEYAMPMSLIPMPDGSTLLQDPLNRRFLVLGPDGKPTGNPISMPNLTPALPGDRGGGIRMGFAMSQGVDGQGRLYFQPPAFTPEGATPDSAAIVRWRPGGNSEVGEAKTETVAHIRLVKGSQSASNRGGRVQVMIGGAPVFSAQEMWGVDAAGRIARVTPSPYQVHWIASGRATSGPVVPYTPVKVTQADKDEVIAQRRRNPGQAITMRVGPGGGTERQVGPPPTLPDLEFAETKPPFWGQNSVLVAPEGEVWVLRTRPAGDAVPTYDVFDRNGAPAKKVSLKPGSRVVGFGKGVVYVARSDEDDLQYLERYKKP